jgi:hypothetical protein
LGEQKIIIEFDRTSRGASQKVARSVRNCLTDAFGVVNQEVVIELVDEEPTEEMMSALDRFWEKVFAELLPAEEEGSVEGSGRSNDVSRAGSCHVTGIVRKGSS